MSSRETKYRTILKIQRSQVQTFVAFNSAYYFPERTYNGCCITLGETDAFLTLLYSKEKKKVVLGASSSPTESSYFLEVKVMTRKKHKCKK